jgi:hypothetical protein
MVGLVSARCPRAKAPVSFGDFQYYSTRGTRWRSVYRARGHRTKPRYPNFAAVDYRADCTPNIKKFSNNIS